MTMRERVWRFLMLAGVLFPASTVMSVDLLGQGTAALVGTVTDASGAIVPATTINLSHGATGLDREVMSNASGIYTAELLQIGQYRVEASKTGFTTFIQEGLVLNTGDRKTLDIRLEIGAVDDEITVTSAGPLIQAASGDISDVITGEQITELAVNGRNFVTLATLTTGVSNNLPDQPGVGVIGNTGGLNINGMHGSYLRITLDGAENQNTGSYEALISYPALDSIAEFRVLTSNYSAEYGGAAGGGQISTVTKSGTTDFHGSVYEFLRNNEFDARNFFAPTVRPLRYNNFGWTLGGPIVKNKDFFFFSQEWRKTRTASQLRTRVPSERERNGDFSSTLSAFTGQLLVLKDPETELPFPNNTIPAARINNNAKLLLDLWPLPNFVDPNNKFINTFTASSAPIDVRQEIIKWDHNFTANHRLMLRYIQDENTTTSVPVQWSATNLPHLKSVMSNPGRNVVVRYTAVISPTLLNEFSFTWSRGVVDVSLVGPFEKPAGLTIKELFPENRANRAPNLLVGGWANVHTGGFPWGNNSNQLTWSDTVTRISGNHSLKVGAYWLYNYRDESLFADTQGSFTFTGQFAGDAVGELLLAKPARYSEADFQPIGHWDFNQIEMFIQDDWKVAPNFTLNLGLRYYYWSPFEEREHRMTSFDPAKFDAAKAATLDPVSGRLLTQPDPLNGLLLAGQNGVPDTLYGGNYLNNVSPRVGFAWDFIGNGKTVLRGGFGMGYYHPEGTFNLTSNPPWQNQQTINLPSLDDPAGGIPAPSFPRAMQILQGYWSPRTAQWSVGIQHEVAANFMAEVAYVGSKGWRLPIRGDINQPGRVEGFDYDPRINEGALALDSFRQYPGYGWLSRAVDTARSNYHSLQLSLMKRLFAGLQFNLGYTWSKAEAAGGGRNGSAEAYATQDNYNLEAEYGPAAWDRRHVFVADYIWELPFLKKGTVGKIFGGWQISGITLAQTGAPSTARLAFPNLGLTTRATVNGPIKYPKNFNQWFLPDALEKPGPGFFGKSSLYSIYQPGMINFNMSVFKNHRINESVNFQLRFEFFNLFNHTNWTNVDTALGSPNIGKVNGARDPRIIQLGARVSF